MTFVDPSAFRGFSLADSYAAGQNIRANNMQMQEMERQRAEREQQRAALSQLTDPNDPGQLAALYRASPELALKAKESQLKQGEIMARTEESKTKAGAAKLGTQEKAFGILRQAAAGLVPQLDQAPTPEAKQAVLDQSWPMIKAQLGPVVGDHFPLADHPSWQQVYQIAGTGGAGYDAFKQGQSALATQQATMPGQLEMERQKAQIEAYKPVSNQTVYTQEMENQRAAAARDFQNSQAGSKAYIEASAKNRAELEGQQATNVQQANQVLQVIDDPAITDLIKKSTSSGSGAAVDMAGRAFGYGTGGAQAIAQLQPIAARLVMMMPRGPGAQSDRDIQLAKEMAANIADPGRSVAEKLASLKGLRDMATKFTMPQQGAAQQQFSSANDVKAAFKNGQISREMARQLLSTQFGM